MEDRFGGGGTEVTEEDTELSYPISIHKGTHPETPSIQNSISAFSYHHHDQHWRWHQHSRCLFFWVHKNLG